MRPGGPGAGGTIGTTEDDRSKATPLCRARRDEGSVVERAGRLAHDVLLDLARARDLRHLPREHAAALGMLHVGELDLSRDARWLRSAVVGDEVVVEGERRFPRRDR